ncbi:MAG TPA: aldose 1-epimerase [Capillimicrobium sp.]|nr:aldose 1-epimerase [Capillimicrobium sp.]
MLTLRAGQLEADVVPEAGMVVASLRHRGEELLGVRRGLDAYVRSGSTFGVPLLYPFANRLSQWRCERIDASAARRDPGTGLPIHGLPAARGAWRVEDDTPDAVRAVLDWDDPAFGPPHRVEVTHALDAAGLRVTTRVEGDGVPVSFGWHPYLAIDRATTELSIPTRRRHVLDDQGIPTGEVEDVAPFRGVLGDRTYDDLFDAPHDGRPFRAGRVAVAFEAGAPYAQVYAPASEGVVAFEPMAAPTNALVTGDALGRSPFEQRFRIELVA